MKNNKETQSDTKAVVTATLATHDIDTLWLLTMVVYAPILSTSPTHPHARPRFIWIVVDNHLINCPRHINSNYRVFNRIICELPTWSAIAIEAWCSSRTQSTLRSSEWSSPHQAHPRVVHPLFVIFRNAHTHARQTNDTLSMHWFALYFPLINWNFTSLKQKDGDSLVPHAHVTSTRHSKPWCLRVSPCFLLLLAT